MDMRFFIDGHRVEPQHDDGLAVISPATGQVLYRLADASTDDVDRAVASARRAFAGGSWSRISPLARKSVLLRFADLIERSARDLNTLDAIEMGKPVSSARFDAAMAAAQVRFAAEATDKLFGAVVPSDRRSHVVKLPRPRGVVAAIVPWNFPTFNAILKVAPALSVGNSVVLKPSELASLSALRLADLAAEAGVPPGVFNVVTGRGTTCGEALARHADIDMITFTGSTATGMALVRASGQNSLKPVMVECGGKSPNIVFADASDLDNVASSIAASAFWNSGQVCSAGTRLLVQREIHDAMVERVVAKAETMLPGDPLDPSTEYGPLVTRRQLDRTVDFVARGKAEGAVLRTGGVRVGPHDGGNFFAPTLFAGVEKNMAIAQEEIFGPVLSVLAFEDESEAIAIANATMYGLTAAVWTSDMATGHRMAEFLEAGGIFVNACVPQGDGGGLSLSLEPWKMSGFGIEYGTSGIESYTRLKTVIFNY